MLQRFPILYVPHGGGPLPVLGDEGHASLVRFLREWAQSRPRPKAIVVISAHWETDSVQITAGAFPKLIYDYGGFPEAAYRLTYPAPGSPPLAGTLVDDLARFGLKANLADRGFDHGLFIPLLLMYPEADIPCLQISMDARLDPQHHIRLGEALQHLPDQGILLLGSGMSFHNLRALFRPDPQAEAHNRAFDDWLLQTCVHEGVDAAFRNERLLHWDQAPSARYCHPREEHLLPLHVCFGAARSEHKTANLVFHDRVMGQKAMALEWT
ncbi:MAG: dioxygenase [Acidobacteria bacterium]|nr:dioxygenase [Acidobacteriota bacterium]MCB9397748.1 dioxygenase [Acidobacteriota bacterium]